MIDQLRKVSFPLNEAKDLNLLVKRIGNAPFVLLGEASHGSAQYYKWRFEISKWLISGKKFSFIAIEGDWPDCYHINRYVKGYPNSGKTAKEVLGIFNRWPTWMWANEEVAEFIEWLREFNKGLNEKDKVGFYGLDLYSLWDSLNAVVEYLEKFHPEALKITKRAYKCFEPFAEDVQNYALTTALVPGSCEDEVVEMLLSLRREIAQFKDEGREAVFNAEQNALITVNAEKYYRTMLKGDISSWNIRDEHMVQTLERLVDFYGENSKAIVWAHNTHVGDARATDMKETEMINIGQLTREKQGSENVVLVGQGCYQGSVIAAEGWGEPMKKMIVPKAAKGSWEDIFHRISKDDKLVIWKEESLRQLDKPYGLRAIGVVYNPTHESGNYVPTILPQCFDAFLYLDQTDALHPLYMKTSPDKDFPETFPSSV